MKNLVKITMASAVVLTMAGPALAQDAFDSTAATGQQATAGGVHGWEHLAHVGQGT